MMKMREGAAPVQEAAPSSIAFDPPAQPTLSSFCSSSGDSSLAACLPMRRPREARSSFLETGMVMVVTCGSPPSTLSSAKTL